MNFVKKYKGTLTIFVLLFILLGGSIFAWGSSIEVRNFVFLVTTGFNGEDTSHAEGQRTISKNYRGAFKNIRSNYGIVAGPTNFVDSSKSAIICDSQELRSNRNFFNLDSYAVDSLIEINLSGFITTCVRELKELSYSTQVGYSSFYDNVYRVNINDYNNVIVRERLDCIAYELNGFKYISFAARISEDKNESNNYDTEFHSSCTLDKLESGSYQLVYDRSDIGLDTIEVK